jgi:hypothetical protein
MYPPAPDYSQPTSDQPLYPAPPQPSAASGNPYAALAEQGTCRIDAGQIKIVLAIPGIDRAQTIYINNLSGNIGFDERSGTFTFQRLSGTANLNTVDAVINFNGNGTFTQQTVPEHVFAQSAQLFAASAGIRSPAEQAAFNAATMHGY